MAAKKRMPNKGQVYSCLPDTVVALLGITSSLLRVE